MSHILYMLCWQCALGKRKSLETVLTGRSLPVSASSSAIMLCQPDAARAVPGVSGAAASRGAGVFQGVGPGLAAAAGSWGVLCACAAG